MKTATLALLFALVVWSQALGQTDPETEVLLRIEARVASVVFERNVGRRLFHRAELEVLSVLEGDAEAKTRLSLRLVHPLDVAPDQAKYLRLLRPGDRARFVLKLEDAATQRYGFADRTDTSGFELIEEGIGRFPEPTPMLLNPDERAADISERRQLFLGLDLVLGSLTFLVAMITAFLLARRAPKPEGQDQAT